VAIGHSLGGALAQIATLMIKIASENDHKEMTVPVRCVTFASPMPFARFPDKVLNSLQKNNRVRVLEWFRSHTVNFINNNDIIPRLPRYAHFVNNFHNISSLRNFFESDTIRAMGELFDSESRDEFIGSDSEKKQHNHTTKHTEDPIMPPTPDFLSILFPDVGWNRLGVCVVGTMFVYLCIMQPSQALEQFNLLVRCIDNSLRFWDNSGLPAIVRDTAHSVNTAMQCLPFQPAQGYLYFMLGVRGCIEFMNCHLLVKDIVLMVVAVPSLLWGFACNWQLMQRHGYAKLFHNEDKIEMIKNPKKRWSQHDPWPNDRTLVHGKVYLEEEARAADAAAQAAEEKVKQAQNEEEAERLRKEAQEARLNAERERSEAEEAKRKAEDPSQVGRVCMVLVTQEDRVKWYGEDKALFTPIYIFKEKEKEGKDLFERPTRLKSKLSRLMRIVLSWGKAHNALRDIIMIIMVIAFVEGFFQALLGMRTLFVYVFGRMIAGWYFMSMTDSLSALPSHHCIDKYVIFVSNQYNMSHNLDSAMCHNMDVLA